MCLLASSMEFLEPYIYSPDEVHEYVACIFYKLLAKRIQSIHRMKKCTKGKNMVRKKNTTKSCKDPTLLKCIVQIYIR